MDYYILLEGFLHTMTNMRDAKELDVVRIREGISGLCSLLRVSKITVSFFENMKQEFSGKSVLVKYYDSGEDSVQVISDRLNTDMLGVAICKIYQPLGAEPWSEVERDRVMLIVNILLVFSSRDRLRKVVDKLTFYDSDDYRNLQYFFRHVQEAAAKGTLGQKAAIQFNLRHFALINQQVGRPVGSYVMRSFFDQLQSHLGEKGLVCRMGGDNFVALCDKEVLEQTLDYLSGTAIVYDINTQDRIMVSASVGVFVIPEDFVLHDPGEIMDKVIPASQTARNSGQNEIIFFNEDMEETKERVAHIQQMFPQALRNEEFQVYYQPKVAVNGDNLAGAEALCRWFHDGQLIPPMEFIPMLEQNTDICKLDFYMLDHVCKDIRRWLDEGRDVVRISVNLSRKHMLDIDLLDHILEIVDRNRVPHEYIEIELTETTTDVEFRDLKRVVRGLQQVGIFTSVDDFGIGYSSLNL
ncbi:MAG: EAL domain-containing protein, partial [Blautia sp.]|nr:EAL domain-containing protein [Blautia sp.]